MEGIIGLVVLIVLLAFNYELFSNITKNISIKNLRSLIVTIANFILVMLFFIALPIVGGYDYENVQDVLDVLFDDSTSYLTVITIVVFCAFIIYYIYGIFKELQENKRVMIEEMQKKAKENERKQIEKEHREREKIIKEAQRQKQEDEEKERIRIEEEEKLQKELIENENKRIAKIKKEITLIRKTYRPDCIKFQPKGSDFKTLKKNLNNDIISAVQKVKESMILVINECNNIDTSINQILKCQDMESVDEKYNYLISQKDQLEMLKSKSNTIRNDILKNKIRLLKEDVDIIDKFKNAFSCLLSSEKIKTNISPISLMVCNEKPKELSLFIYEKEPLILLLKQFYFCIFGYVTLVFDKDGFFSTALNTGVLSIEINRLTEDVLVQNNFKPKTKYVASDSKLLETGSTQTTWLHTCLDGSPDLRYRNNTRTDYRTDTYEYGKIEFDISGVKLICTVSSKEAIDAFEILKTKCVTTYKTHNPIPDILELVKRTSDKKDLNIDLILDRYNSLLVDKNTFCEIVSEH